MAPDPEDLTVERSDAVAVVTLLADRRLNALRRSFWRSMREALLDLEADDQIRCVVIRGDGDRAFSAGGDIHGYADLDSAPARRAFIVDCMRTFEAVETCTKPVIAAVNGLAFGGGFELALACDMVVAADTATFGAPEATLGLVPGFGVLRLVDHVGPGWARYLVLSGRQIDAATAERLGLVQLVVPPAQLMESALALADDVARNAPLATAVGKAVLNGRLHTDYAASIDPVVMLQSTQDAAEGIASFREKRSPRFTGE